MKPTLARSLDLITFAAAFLFVAGFIGADLITAACWDWRGRLTTLRQYLWQPGDEIRNYVEFIKVEYEGWVVTTGIEFDSSWSRQITGQWCYLKTEMAELGEPQYQLTLAIKPGSELIVPNRFTLANLGPFDLGASEAQSLIQTHCRFRQ